MMPETATFALKILRKTHYKVKDPCHICGKFVGRHIQNAILDIRLRRDIPVFFHNLRRYDSHLIMQEIADNLSRIQFGY